MVIRSTSRRTADEAQPDDAPEMAASLLALAAALHDAETWPDRAREIDAQRRAAEEHLAWEAHWRSQGASRAHRHTAWKVQHVRAQDGRCHYCGTDFDDGVQVATLDHVEPLARGGADTIENTVAACRACNSAKGDSDPVDFAAAIRMHRRGVLMPFSHNIARGDDAAD